MPQAAERKPQSCFFLPAETGTHAEQQETARFQDSLKQHILSLGAMLRRSFQPDDIEEAIAVTLFRVAQYQDDGRLQEILDFPAWLHRVAWTAALTIVRSKRPFVSIESLPLAASSHTGSKHLLGDVIRAAVADLPDHQRQVIEMRFFEGVTQEGAAAALGIPKARLRQREAAAISRLRTMLAEDFA